MDIRIFFNKRPCGEAQGEPSPKSAKVTTPMAISPVVMETALAEVDHLQANEDPPLASVSLSSTQFKLCK